MKKLLLVLLVVALASFLLTGCFGVPDGTEGEGEGEGETGTVVAIAGSVVVDGKTYVSGGTHEITVTFPAAVVGTVTVAITGCGGDYRDTVPEDVVMFPDATRMIWTGSGDFGYGTGCCASYVQVESGECLADVCIEFPVIVDSCDPYALVEIDVDNCTCEDCKLIFTTGEEEGVCAPDTECCGDDCSELASWSIVLYEGYPFDECCDPSICEEPIGSCSGTACPVECTTECLDKGTYWAVVTLVDNVGNDSVYYAEIEITGGLTESDTCEIVVAEYVADSAPTCVVFDETHEWVGTCEEVCVLPL